MNEALIDVAKQTPLIALLLIAVRYLLKRNEKLEQDNKDLNMLYRDQQQKTIDALSEQTRVNEKLIKIINEKDEEKKKR